MGDRRLSFTLRSYDHAGKYPDLMTGKRTFANFVRIHDDWKRLTKVMRRLRSTLQAIDDSTLVIGANLHTYANTFYNVVGDSLEDGIPGLTLVYQELQVQYEALRGGRPGNGGDPGTDPGTDPGGSPTAPNGGAPIDGDPA